MSLISRNNKKFAVRSLGNNVSEIPKQQLYGSHSTTNCPKCDSSMAKFTSVVFTNGTKRRRIVCYNPQCRAESF